MVEAPAMLRHSAPPGSNTRTSVASSPMTTDGAVAEGEEYAMRQATASESSVER